MGQLGRPDFSRTPSSRVVESRMTDPRRSCSSASRPGGAAAGARRVSTAACSDSAPTRPTGGRWRSASGRRRSSSARRRARRSTTSLSSSRATASTPALAWAARSRRAAPRHRDRRGGVRLHELGREGGLLPRPGRQHRRADRASRDRRERRHRRVLAVRAARPLRGRARLRPAFARRGARARARARGLGRHRRGRGAARLRRREGADADPLPGRAALAADGPARRGASGRGHALRRARTEPCLSTTGAACL